MNLARKSLIGLVLAIAALALVYGMRRIGIPDADILLFGVGAAVVAAMVREDKRHQARLEQAARSLPQSPSRTEQP